MITNSFDTTAPTLSAMNVEGCNLDTSVAALGSAIADDANCAYTLIWSDAVTTVGCADIIDRTWTATDACGNSASVVQIISKWLRDQHRRRRYRHRDRHRRMQCRYRHQCRPSTSPRRKRNHPPRVDRHRRVWQHGQ